MESTTTNPVRWTVSDLAIFEGDRANRYEIIDGELLRRSWWSRYYLRVRRTKDAIEKPS